VVEGPASVAAIAVAEAAVVAPPVVSPVRDFLFAFFAVLGQFNLVSLFLFLLIVFVQLLCFAPVFLHLLLCGEACPAGTHKSSLALVVKLMVLFALGIVKNSWHCATFAFVSLCDRFITFFPVSPLVCQTFFSVVEGCFAVFKAAFTIHFKV
jgi:hypothetical protein